MPIGDEEIEVRRTRILELSGKPSEASVPPLLQALEDASWRIRKTATEMLLKEHPPDRYMKGLIDLLYLENAGARNSAIEALIRLGRKATAFLIAAFDTPNRDVRKFIIDIIGEVKDRASLPVLLKALKDDDDNVRASAVEHLGQMGDTSVVDALIEILRSGDVWTAFPAADALGRIGDRKAIPALLDALSVKALRESVLKGLGHISDAQTLAQIAPLLMDPSRSIQETALNTIGVFYHKGVPADTIAVHVSDQCGPELIDRLIAHAHSRKAEVRVNAMLLLGILQDERALGPLVELSADEAVVEDAKKALIFIGKGKPASLFPFFETDNQTQKRFMAEVAMHVGSSLYQQLFVKLIDDEDGHVRAFAALGLSKIPDKGHIQVIRKLLYDPYPDVQEAAVSALANLREWVDTEAVIRDLSDKRAALRRNAALLLGLLSVEESVDALGFRLKDEDVAVRQAVVEALSSLKTPASIKYLVIAITDEYPRIRASAALSLGTVGGDKALDSLSILLSDPDDSVKGAAVRALSTLGDRRATVHLIPLLCDPNGFVVTTALESLSTLGGMEAREAILGMLASSDVEMRRTAIRSLAPFEAVEDVVLPYLHDPDWATRIAAVEVLGSRKTEGVTARVERLYDTEEDPAVRRAIKDHFDVR